MPISAPSRRARGKLAQLVAEQNKRPNDPSLRAQVDAVRAEYRALALEDHIREVVEAAPPIPQASRDRLALILRGAS